MDKQLSFPQQVKDILSQLKQAGFEGFVVGGCLRDVLRGEEPKDWDVTTNALPKQIQKIFPKSFYANTFGTVTVQHNGMAIEITTYRSEAKYTDKRHPDAVTFGVSLKEDLARRDFTINAMASDAEILHDPFDGQKDLQKRIIRAVGDPQERFNEDALRIIRAIRFAGALRMNIEKKTWQAIIKNAELIKALSKERIRDEILKILASEDALRAFWLLYVSGILKLIMPELLEGEGMSQNKHHIYTVLFHNLFSMAYCPSEDPLVKLSALLHDVGKPRTKEGQGLNASFHAHEIIGAEMTRGIMKRLKFSNEEIEKVSHLVRHHMFYYSVGEITDAGVRRIVRRIGPENIENMMSLRIGDRMGSGVQKEKPYKLIELEKRIEEVQRDPITTSMLALDGHNVMTLIGLKPGKMIGIVLNTLLEEVLDDPSKNTKKYLESRIGQMKPQALDGTLPEPPILQEDQKERFERIEKQKRKS